MILSWCMHTYVYIGQNILLQINKDICITTRNMHVLYSYVVKRNNTKDEPKYIYNNFSSVLTNIQKSVFSNCVNRKCCLCIAEATVKIFVSKLKLTIE